MTNREKAELMVEGWTGGRSKAATGYKLERVNRLIEFLIAELDKRDKMPTGIKSISNDKYSETYETISEDTFNQIMKVVAFEMLSGTGLMGCL